MNKSTKIGLAAFWVLFVACFYYTIFTQALFSYSWMLFDKEGQYTLIWLILFSIIMNIKLIAYGKRFQNPVKFTLASFLLALGLIILFVFIGLLLGVYNLYSL